MLLGLLSGLLSGLLGGFPGLEGRFSPGVGMIWVHIRAARRMVKL